MFWDHVDRNRHIMQEFEDIEAESATTLDNKNQLTSSVNRYKYSMKMNGYSKPMSETLYLYKHENDEIYVDSLLHQHHIDGIRFLYKQFKKKNPGVIINNPLGYGNSMQVALFLGAIQHLLDKPILILCEQSEELNWLEHFQKLTQCYNVCIAAESPFVKKTIFINTMERLEQFCRRDWGVLVVDNDAFLKEKTLQTKFKADFKIWITPVNMKSNLQTFASIFKWLYPKDKLNIEDFKEKPGDIKDAVMKSIMLDAFLQDVVCRTHLLTPFENPYPKSEGTPQKSSKKNKDATGTKIKRSKRALDIAGTSNGIQENGDMGAGASAVKVSKKDEPNTDTGDFSIGNFKISRETTKECDDKPSVITEMDVESFIRNEKPIGYEPFNDFMQDYDDISPNSENSRTDFMEDEPTIFDTPEKLERNDVSDASMDIADNPYNYAIDSDTNSNLVPEKSFKESSPAHDSSENKEISEQMSPKFVTDDIQNDANNEISNTQNDKSIIDTKPEPEEVKTPVKESPNKDLNTKLKEIDEQVFKKFQGSLLDRLF